MVMILWQLLTDVVFVEMGNLALSGIYALMPCLVMLVGLMILLSAVGMKVSNNLGSTIMRGIFSAIAFVVRGILKIIPVLAVMVINVLKNAFARTKQFCKKRGMTEIKCNIIATIVLIIVIAIII